MTREFCDRCGKEVKKGPVGGRGGTPTIEGKFKVGPWKMLLKVHHMIGGALGGIVCDDCVSTIVDAMDKAFELIGKTIDPVAYEREETEASSSER